ncbi:UNVERIFIED_CONTAM: general negative regulator of transcription subunit 5 [Siphonaria sp. JEL0065]|nr:general negative regulator of transcription subunit 5 [Siphonaria sp. JEL0065]
MSNRKLQAEIDKVIKLIAAGVEAFEAVYNKIATASNATQKEKLEGDLKKEIKKLQRFRDQIKTWIGSSEIKDKAPLLENRRLIETQMEKFKAMEKELKTKAFSKEGLLATTKLDPAEQERLDLADTLREIIEKLETQIDAFEFETEKLRTGGAKKKDQAKIDKILKWEKGIERHKHHIKMIEIVLRLLENGDTDSDLVKNLIEDVNYYVDSNQDPEFEEDEGIYDELNLDDAEAYGINADDDNSEESEGEELPAKAKPDPKSNDDLKKKAKEDLPASPVKQTIKVVPAKPVPAKEEAPKTPVKVAAKAGVTATPQQPARVNSDIAAAAVAPVIQAGPIRYAAAAAANANVNQSPLPAAPVVEKKKPEPVAQAAPAPVHVSAAVPVAAAVVQPVVAAAQSPTRNVANSQWASPQDHVVVPAAVTIALAATKTPVGQIKKEVIPEPAATPQEPLDNRLPPALKDMITSFVSTKERSTTKSRDDSLLFNHMLETSFRFIPEPLDFDRQKHYVPQTSYPTPSYYPQHPLPIFENPAAFEKFDIDTLFFIFYHQQGTYQQYLAAQELKKQSWRFHKKYQTWFQRFEEPKAITDEYEQGTYIYFDCEGSWCQRKKLDFRFDYKWLEDESV